MKATDLMIGDWVLINNIPHKIQAIDSIDAEIQADDEIYYVGEDRCHSEDKIEGIPLTPEILEKNGFHLELSSDKENVYSHFDKGDCTPIIFLSAGQEKWTLHVKNYILKKCLDFTIFHDTLYVHELQHTLQLCGLDELADNFKV